jgi:hypothetical protein
MWSQLIYLSGLIDTFTRAYLECALWSSTDESTPQGGEPMDQNYSVTDIAPDTLAAMVRDCQKFQQENADDIAFQCDRAGHDFWLTRNGHGAGFWDGDWPNEVGTRLTEASKKYGEFNLYIGDDGLIYGC